MRSQQEVAEENGKYKGHLSSLRLVIAFGVICAWGGLAIACDEQNVDNILMLYLGYVLSVWGIALTIAGFVGRRHYRSLIKWNERNFYY